MIGMALELGFTSVMFDGSHLPLEENIAETKKSFLWLRNIPQRLRLRSVV